MGNGYDIVQIKLENDLAWEPIIRTNNNNEEAIRSFCAYHPEYYDVGVKFDGYRDLRIDIKENGCEVKKYAVYIDHDSKFFIKQL